jgi:hypothetical protein
MLAYRFFCAEGHFFDLSPEVHEQKLRFFEFCENFLGFVDLISEVDAAVVETLGVVHAWIMKNVAESAWGIVPKKFSGISWH